MNKIHIRTQDEFRELVLPGPGGTGGREGLHLEYKSEQGRVEHTAGDIAAMANAEGGTILFGVKEDQDRRSVAERIREIDERRVYQHIHQAVDAWTSGLAHTPATERLAIDGQVVVALHIFPSPSPICVKRKDGSLAYPLRTIEDTRYLTHDEITMRITSYSARATRIRLAEILAEPRAAETPAIEITLHHVDPNGASQLWSAPECTCHLVELGEHGAWMQFQIHTREFMFQVPYQWIDPGQIWTEPVSNRTYRWAIKANAFFQQQHIRGNMILTAQPNI